MKPLTKELEGLVNLGSRHAVHPSALSAKKFIFAHQLPFFFHLPSSHGVFTQAASLDWLCVCVSVDLACLGKYASCLLRTESPMAYLSGKNRNHALHSVGNQHCQPSENLPE